MEKKVINLEYMKHKTLGDVIRKKKKKRKKKILKKEKKPSKPSKPSEELTVREKILKAREILKDKDDETK